MSVRVNLLYCPGTNCQREAARSFEAVGAKVEVVYLSEVLAGRQRLDTADLLCLPGGFAHGDHVGAGVIAALQLRVRVPDQLAACRMRPMLCICNGFQIAVRAGLFGDEVGLTINANGTFRHVADQPHFVRPDNGSPWLAGLGGAILTFPCAHGEGQFVFTGLDGWRPALMYPPGRNPDGSTDGIAGITSADGVVFGLMNHPERAAHDHQNLEIFRNGVRAAGGK